MNLKSKNGEDVLTLDAAERRCLTNAMTLCARIHRIAPDGTGLVAESAHHYLEKLCLAIPERAKAKAGAEK